MNMLAIIEQQKILPYQNISWLQSMRELALNQFQALGFPNSRQEEWKYTNLSLLLKQSFCLPTPTPFNLEFITSHLITENYLVFIDGRFMPNFSHLPQLAKGIIAGGIAEQLLKPEKTLVEQYLGKVASKSDKAFTILNTAFIEDGAFIYFPAEVAMHEPVQLLFMSTQTAWIQPRNLVVFAPNAKGTLIETYVSLNNSVTNTVTEIVLQDSAKLDHLKIQNEHTDAFHMGSTFVDLSGHAKYKSHVISLGSALSRSNLYVDLLGKESQCDLQGIYIAKGKQHTDHYTCINHAVPHCYSHELYRGILMDKSRAVFNGKVIVQPDAQQTRAEQANHNLLLSSEAEIDTKPELEIYADDVQCTHGATVGQIDENALFYLKSRGIIDSIARQMLMQAFANEIISNISDDTIASKLIDYLKVVLLWAR